MGEMADYLNDSMMDASPEWNPFGTPRRASSTVCKYCGMKGLKWKQLDSGWRLVISATEVLHICKQYVPKTQGAENDDQDF